MVSLLIGRLISVPSAALARSQPCQKATTTARKERERSTIGCENNGALASLHHKTWHRFNERQSQTNAPDCLPPRFSPPFNTQHTIILAIMFASASLLREKREILRNSHHVRSGHQNVSNVVMATTATSSKEMYTPQPPSAASFPQHSPNPKELRPKQLQDSFIFD